MGLLGRAGAGHGADLGALTGVRPAQGLQMVDALGPGDEPGVGDGVGGAGQQVGETERLAERARAGSRATDRSCG